MLAADIFIIGSLVPTYWTRQSAKKAEMIMYKLIALAEESTMLNENTFAIDEFKRAAEAGYGIALYGIDVDVQDFARVVNLRPLPSAIAGLERDVKRGAYQDLISATTDKTTAKEWRKLVGDKLAELGEE